MPEMPPPLDAVQPREGEVRWRQPLGAVLGEDVRAAHRLHGPRLPEANRLGSDIRPEAVHGWPPVSLLPVERNAHKRGNGCARVGRGAGRKIVVRTWSLIDADSSAGATVTDSSGLRSAEPVFFESTSRRKRRLFRERGKALKNAFVSRRQNCFRFAFLKRRRRKGGERGSEKRVVV